MVLPSGRTARNERRRSVVTSRRAGPRAVGPAEARAPALVPSMATHAGGTLRVVVRHEAGARRGEAASVARGQPPAVAAGALLVDREPQRAGPEARLRARGRAVERARGLPSPGGHTDRLSAL